MTVKELIEALQALSADEQALPVARYNEYWDDVVVIENCHIEDYARLRIDRDRHSKVRLVCLS